MPQGGVIGKANEPTEARASGLWRVGEVFRARKTGTWVFRPIQATGGTVTDVEIGGRLFRVHVFESSGDFVVTDAGSNRTVDVLMIGGGGGGGGGSVLGSAGGGAGGAIDTDVTVASGTYSIGVGDGGPGADGRENGTQGSDTEAFGLTALGGARGREADTQDGFDGGCGSGAVVTLFNQTRDGGTGLQPTSADGGLGNRGGDGVSDSTRRAFGGGGGIGEAGEDATINPVANTAQSGSGGDGINFSAKYGTSFGADGAIGGGGGSGNDLRRSGHSPGLSGGLGGGGAPGQTSSEAGQDALASTGSGGGGTCGADEGGDGASGVVVVRYPLEVA